MFLSYYYYKGYLPLNQFLTATVAALLSVLTIILLLTHAQQEVVAPGINLKWGLYVLPYVVFVSSLIDVYLYGHLGVFSVLSLILTFTILALSKYDLYVALIGVVTLAMIISVLYGIYVPSFGTDTWRDAIQARQIVKRGGLRDLTVLPVQFPFPLVSLLYAVYGIISSVETVWSNSIIGIFYLFLLILWIHILSKKLNLGYHRIASLLALITPLIIVWSACFISQAYALLMALPLLFLKLHFLIVIVLIVALVFGHSGMALWTLSIFLIVIIFIKMPNIKASKHVVLQQIKTKFVLFVIIFSTYAIYTIILMVLKKVISSVFDTIIAFLSGEKVMIEVTPLQTPITSILGIIPAIIIAVMGLVRMLEDNDIILRLFTIISLAGLAIAYVGSVAFPPFDLPRYLGLGSITLLVILSPQAFQSLIRRGKVGMSYAYALLFLTILSFGFAGTLMPSNTYTANTYSTWSISGLITYSEAQELKNIASLLCCNNFLIDWRAGSYLHYTAYLWAQPRYRGFYDYNCSSSFVYAGLYRLRVTLEYLKNFNGIWIFRNNARQMPEAYLNEISLHIIDVHINASVVYFGGNIRILDLSRNVR